MVQGQSPEELQMEPLQEDLSDSKYLLGKFVNTDKNVAIPKIHYLSRVLIDS